jgi:hypothetical protein
MRLLGGFFMQQLLPACPLTTQLVKQWIEQNTNNASHNKNTNGGLERMLFGEKPSWTMPEDGAYTSERSADDKCLEVA